MPFVDATWAIPLLITPAPITPILLTDIDVHSYPSSAERGAAWRKRNSLADVLSCYSRECNKDGASIDCEKAVKTGIDADHE